MFDYFKQMEKKVSEANTTWAGLRSQGPTFSPEISLHNPNSISAASILFLCFLPQFRFVRCEQIHLFSTEHRQWQASHLSRRSAFFSTAATAGCTYAPLFFFFFTPFCSI
jgi:hypothetical protein